AQVEGEGPPVEAAEGLEIAREPIEQRALPRSKRGFEVPRPARRGVLVGKEPAQQLRVKAKRPLFEPSRAKLGQKAVPGLVVEGEGRLAAAAYKLRVPRPFSHVEAQPREERRDQLRVRALAPGLYLREPGDRADAAAEPLLAPVLLQP